MFTLGGNWFSILVYLRLPNLTCTSLSHNIEHGFLAVTNFRSPSMRVSHLYGHLRRCVSPKIQKLCLHWFIGHWTHLLSSSTAENGCDLDGWIVDGSLLSNRGAWHYSPWSGPTTLENRRLLPEMEVIRMVLRVCKQTRVGCDYCCCDSFVCYVDHLLCHDFSGSNPFGFSAKRKRKEN